ncbi:Na(+)/dicarboxylate cotransporter 3-like [Ornithodoros turicata]|uniref:Na(+)/dicarboxylate cotransporter 3-like n=1 Tax=Ornithodoros turicata TaxID=34597 RepID=UPI00313A04BC
MQVEEEFVWPFIRRKHTDNALVIFGIFSPLLLLPIVLIGTNEAKCIYCVCTASFLLLTEAVPAQIVAFVPFIVFINRDFTQFYNFRTILNELLHQVSIMVMILSMESTSVLQRTSLWLLAFLGTRARNLLCGCLVGSIFCSFFMGDTAAVLLMAGLTKHVVKTLQADVIKAFHQRTLYDKATAGLSQLRQRLLTVSAEFVPLTRSKMKLALSTGNTIKSSTISVSFTPGLTNRSCDPGLTNQCSTAGIGTNFFYESMRNRRSKHCPQPFGGSDKPTTVERARRKKKRIYKEERRRRERRIS